VGTDWKTPLTWAEKEGPKSFRGRESKKGKTDIISPTKRIVPGTGGKKKVPEKFTDLTIWSYGGK